VKSVAFWTGRVEKFGAGKDSPVVRLVSGEVEFEMALFIGLDLVLGQEEGVDWGNDFFFQVG